MISIIHPSRSRPFKSFENILKWFGSRSRTIDIEIIVSLDNDDPLRNEYVKLYWDAHSVKLTSDWNKSSVEAINRGAELAQGDIMIVVSDDTSPIDHWDTKIYEVVKDKTDWILKTQDGIQPYIITMPVIDRAYFNRTDTIYHPEFDHMFCDTYMTCVADITGRKITSDLVFHHDNPGHYGKPIDDINRKNDATWSQGEETFIRLMKQFSKEDLQKIKDRQMVRWLRNKGVQV